MRLLWENFTNVFDIVATDELFQNGLYGYFDGELIKDRLSHDFIEIRNR